MSSPNTPPIPPIPHFPPLPRSEQPVEQKRRWWFWGLIGCGALLVGFVIVAILAAVAIPFITKARVTNDNEISLRGPAAGPEWLPAYPNAKNVTQVAGKAEAGWNTGGLSFSTSDTEETVIRFYRERLTALGIPGQQSYDQATENRMYTAQTSDGTRYISVGASRAGRTTIVGIGYRSKN